jgi:hypothetical protein
MRRPRYSIGSKHDVDTAVSVDSGWPSVRLGGGWMATQGEYMDLPLSARVSEHMPDGHYVRKLGLHFRFLLDRVFQIVRWHGGEGSQFASLSI